MFKFELIIIAVVLLSLQLSSGSESEDGIVVETSSGKVRGTSDQSAFTQKPFYQFRGIPYAKASRFRAPEKADTWDGVFEAINYSAVCPQLNYDTEDVDGDENSCLTINVFTPEIRKSVQNKFPVVVFITGGSFQFEGGSHYSPHYLLEEQQVVVTFNYRLGVLGFLSTGSDGVIQGNFGLKDQVLALKFAYVPFSQWVRENIANFNGDPERITLMGLSSGGISVHLHMISPMSQGLFHQAISHSGVAFSPWAIVRKPEIRVEKLAKLTNCSRETNQEIRDCLLQVDFARLIDKQPGFSDWYIDPIVPVGPVIEKTGEDEIFLSDFPYQLVKQGKFQKNIPYIMGVNSHEGLLHSADIVNNMVLNRVINMEWERAAPITLLYKYTSFDSSATSKAISEYYFQDKSINSTTLENLTNMYSDRYFFHGIHHTAKTHLQSGAEAPIYLYYFDHQGDRSVIHFNEKNSEIKGVCHYDQAQYLFRVENFGEIAESEYEFAKTFINSLYRFVESGKPGDPEWKAVELADIQEGGSLQYNVIGSKVGTIAEPFTERIKFWDSLTLMELERELDMDFIENMAKLEESTLDETNNVSSDEKTPPRNTNEKTEL